MSKIFKTQRAKNPLRILGDVNPSVNKRFLYQNRPFASPLPPPNFNNNERFVPATTTATLAALLYNKGMFPSSFACCDDSVDEGCSEGVETIFSPDISQSIVSSIHSFSSNDECAALDCVDSIVSSEDTIKDNAGSHLKSNSHCTKPSAETLVTPVPSNEASGTAIEVGEQAQDSDFTTLSVTELARVQHSQLSFESTEKPGHCGSVNAGNGNAGGDESSALQVSYRMEEAGLIASPRETSVPGETSPDIGQPTDCALFEQVLRGEIDFTDFESLASPAEDDFQIVARKEKTSKKKPTSAAPLAVPNTRSALSSHRGQWRAPRYQPRSNVQSERHPPVSRDNTDRKSLQNVGTADYSKNCQWGRKAMVLRSQSALSPRPRIPQNPRSQDPLCAFTLAKWKAFENDFNWLLKTFPDLVDTF